MIILGICEGHNASACLMKDGEIVAAVNEERFTKIKNDVGYPKQAIEYCLKEGSITPDKLDIVAIATINFGLIELKTKKEAAYKIKDWLLEQHEYFKPLLLEKKDPIETKWNFLQEFEKKNGVQITHYDFTSLNKNNLSDPDFCKEVRRKAVINHLHIDPKKIRFVEHHKCHQYYAYYSSPFREDCLVLTVDGFGDGANATVSIVNNDNNISTVYSTSNCQIARIYRYITLLLGMKPHEHEYKVMGLAPYANVKEVDKSYKVFSDILKVNDLEFSWKNKPKDFYFHFIEKLEGHRFDGIAGALQKMTEELVSKWAQNAIKRTGIKTVVFSGGMAMNIKLNLAVASLPEVKKFFVSLSPSDESNIIGACYYIYDLYCEKNRINKNCIKPVRHAYLGPDFTEDEVRNTLAQNGLNKRYIIKENISHKHIAQKLAEGKTVGICKGRMEFGARALGNRSILANPSNPQIIQKINNQIKFRDFWMPFTPTILYERVQDYLHNPKNLYSPFMTVGLHSKPLAQKELIAALHPADMTARPQMLKKEVNPDYYDIIKEFENLTGIGGVLNTSLNLHGHPIVNTPEDAVFIMENSDLDMLYFGSILLERKRENSCRLHNKKKNANQSTYLDNQIRKESK